ncbi:MAG: SDR family oxidoreductase [Gammaproteobacteria bacterium]|nr:SDR family oxidoreductase [Gammaproteobacteria bacterium]
MDKWGRIDALVNNAGTTSFVNHADLAGLDKQDFFDIYGVNLVGPYQMTRAAEKALGDWRRSGAMVDVSWIAGVRGGRQLDCLCRLQGCAADHHDQIVGEGHGSRSSRQLHLVPVSSPASG